MEAVASLFLTPLLFDLPIVTLAATIIVAELCPIFLNAPGWMNICSEAWPSDPNCTGRSLYAALSRRARLPSECEGDPGA